MSSTVVLLALSLVCGNDVSPQNSTMDGQVALETIPPEGELRRFGLSVGWGFIADHKGLPGIWGAHVHRVEPGSTAEKVGLKEGDLILLANGEEVARSSDFATKDSVSNPTYRLGRLLSEPGKVRLRVHRPGLLPDSGDHDIEFRIPAR